MSPVPRTLRSCGRNWGTANAQRVRLSVAACHRRLRALEQAGAIRGYRAVINPAAIGRGFEVLVFVTMDREDATTIAEFERDLAEGGRGAPRRTALRGP